MDKYQKEYKQSDNSNFQGSLSEKDFIVGRNAVLEALRANRPIDKIFVSNGQKRGSILPLLQKAKEKDIVIKEVDSAKLDHMVPGVSNHQGIIAVSAMKAYVELDTLFETANDKGEPPFFLICDGFEDPHNFGAVLRIAACSGVHGVIIPKRRSVGLTSAVSKVSAGAMEYVPVVRVNNIPDTIEKLKQAGVWIYAADMDGEAWCGTDFSGPVALIIGSEGTGVGRLVKEKSDFVVSIPMTGTVNSLNASVSAGIICFEILRQRSGLHAMNP